MWTSSDGQTFPSFFVETHPFPISGPEPRLWQNCGTSAPQSHRLWILPGRITYCLYISCRLTNYSSFCFLTCTLGPRVRVCIYFFFKHHRSGNLWPSKTFLTQTARKKISCICNLLPIPEKSECFNSGIISHYSLLCLSLLFWKGQEGFEHLNVLLSLIYISLTLHKINISWIWVSSCLTFIISHGSYFTCYIKCCIREFLYSLCLWLVSYKE